MIYISSHFEIGGQLFTFDLGIILQRRLRYVKEANAACIILLSLPDLPGRTLAEHDFDAFVYVPF